MNYLIATVFKPLSTNRVGKKRTCRLAENKFEDRKKLIIVAFLSSSANQALDARNRTDDNNQ